MPMIRIGPESIDPQEEHVDLGREGVDFHGQRLQHLRSHSGRDGGSCGVVDINAGGRGRCIHRYARESSNRSCP